MNLQFLYARRLSYTLTVFLAVALVLSSQVALASDKFGGGGSTSVRTSDGGSVRISNNSRTSAVDVTNGRTQTTTQLRDFNRDGDYNDPNEQLSSRRESGGSDNRGSTPQPCTGIDIAVTSIRLEPANQPAASPAASQTSRLSSLTQRNTSSYTGSITTSSATGITGVSYVPVVTVQNIGCRPTNNPPTTGSGSRFTSTRTTTTYFKNELPFGSAGGFPVHLRVDLGADGSFETTNHAFNQGPLAAGRAITVRFPAIVLSSDGNHVLRAVADPTNVQAPNNSCAAGTLGDWGCVRESDRGTNNVRTLTVRTATPRVTLGSFIINTNPRLVGSVPPIADASTANSRDISALTSQQQMGLYWTGQSVDFSTCTGSIRTNAGSALSGFSGRRDTTGLSLWALLRLPTNANQVDSNIPEPGQDDRYTYTIACRTSAGTVVSDSLSLFRGVVPPEPVDVPSDCRDGIDNDGDGVLDQNDNGCWSNPGDPGSYDEDDTSEVNTPANVPTISVVPELVRRGESVRVEWNTRGNTGCTVAGGNIATPISASGPGNTMSIVNAQTTFTITCDQGVEAEAVVRILPVLYES